MKQTFRGNLEGLFYAFSILTCVCTPTHQSFVRAVYTAQLWMIGLSSRIRASTQSTVFDIVPGTSGREHERSKAVLVEALQSQPMATREVTR